MNIWVMLDRYCIRIVFYLKGLRDKLILVNYVTGKVGLDL